MYKIEPLHGNYIISYTFDNGSREETRYITKIYNRNYTFESDYIRAKKMAKSTAEKHIKYLTENNIIPR